MSSGGDDFQGDGSGKPTEDEVGRRYSYVSERPRRPSETPRPLEVTARTRVAVPPARPPSEPRHSPLRAPIDELPKAPARRSSPIPPPLPRTLSSHLPPLDREEPDDPPLSYSAPPPKRESLLPGVIPSADDTIEPRDASTTDRGRTEVRPPKAPATPSNPPLYRPEARRASTPPPRPDEPTHALARTDDVGTPVLDAETLNALPTSSRADVSGGFSPVDPKRDVQWQRLWLATLRREWLRLVIVPAAPETDTLRVARTLAAVGREHIGKPVDLVDATELELGSLTNGLEDLARRAEAGRRTIVALPSVLTNPIALTIAQSCEASLVCVRLGDPIDAAMKTIEELGVDHVLGTFVVHPRARAKVEARPAPPKRGTPENNAASKAKKARP